jgi:hypothetical protein
LRRLLAHHPPRRESGLPFRVNTSFNVREEPIVNKLSECVRALRDGCIDFVVTAQGIYERVLAPSERAARWAPTCSSTRAGEMRDIPSGDCPPGGTIGWMNLE